MEYIIYRSIDGIKRERFGSFYPNIDTAKQDIKEAGIYLLCGILPIDGKLQIIHTSYYSI